MPKNVGRPTEYKPRYSTEIIDHFNINYYTESHIVYETKSFRKVEKKRVPVPLPTLEGLYDSRFAVFVAQNFTDMRMQAPDIKITYSHVLGDAEMRILESQKRLL